MSLTTVALTRRCIRSSLLYFILVVFGLSSEEQICPVDTNGIVAVMQHIKVVRIDAVSKQIHHPGCDAILPAYPKRTVSRVEDSTDPRPTNIGCASVDVGAEPDNFLKIETWKRYCRSRHQQSFLYPQGCLCLGADGAFTRFVGSRILAQRKEGFEPCL